MNRDQGRLGSTREEAAWREHDLSQLRYFRSLSLTSYRYLAPP
jgi:hypothetical protein